MVASHDGANLTSVVVENFDSGRLRCEGAAGRGEASRISMALVSHRRDIEHFKMVRGRGEYDIALRSDTCPGTIMARVGIRTCARTSNNFQVGVVADMY